MNSRDVILEKMEVCASMPFTVISNSANQFLQTAYAQCNGVDTYVEYSKWYYEKACDILDHPEKYDGMSCTEIVEGFHMRVRKDAVALYKKHGDWYGAMVT